MSAEYYVLDGHKPVPASMWEWAIFLADIDARRIARTMVGDALVSTVFFGSVYRLDPHDQLDVFETIIFGGNRDQEKRCYSTWDEAVAGHDEIVASLRGRDLT